MLRVKDYVSWSQYSLFNKSKKEYWKRYGLGIESKSNKYFAKGNELGAYLETGKLPEYAHDPLLEMVGNAVPKLDLMEERLDVEVGGEKLLAFIDSGSLDGSKFLEYKTGKEPWTQLRVDMHEQLDFYALCYYKKNDVIPSCTLVWVETEEYENEEGWKALRYTGQVESFSRNFILSDLVKMEKKILRTIREIDEFDYTELELEDTTVDRYLYLKTEMAIMKDEMDSIKEEVMADMLVNEVNYSSGQNGRFSITSRKSWSYSKELTKKAAEYKVEVTSLQKKEQKDEVATYSISKSLMFKEVK